MPNAVKTCVSIVYSTVKVTVGCCREGSELQTAGFTSAYVTFRVFCCRKTAEGEGTTSTTSLPMEARRLIHHCSLTPTQQQQQHQQCLPCVGLLAICWTKPYQSRASKSNTVCSAVVRLSQTASPSPRARAGKCSQVFHHEF